MILYGRLTNPNPESAVLHTRVAPKFHQTLFTLILFACMMLLKLLQLLETSCGVAPPPPFWDGVVSRFFLLVASGILHVAILRFVS